MEKNSKDFQITIPKVPHCAFISTKLWQITNYFGQSADNNKTKAVTGICLKKSLKSRT